MIVLAALILGIFIFLSTGMLAVTIDKMDKSDTARHATMKCLIDLVTELNKRFPGSNLVIQDTTDCVKVLGELKYYKKN